MKIDFHVHTVFSGDSTITPDSLIKKSRELGIVPALTDHSSMDAISQFKESKLPFIPGEELRVTTPSGKADLIGLFMNQPIPKNTDFYEALDLLKGQGALTYAPHPFDSLRAGLNDEKFLKEIQIIEVFNSHCLSHFDLKAEEFAKRENKSMGAGSDAHFLFEFGTTYVELELDELEPKKLLKALKNGKIVGKRSPKVRRFVHRIASGILKPFV